ncbi:MAG: DeoR/GlpR family DNA-binding transcription regulator [Lachnospiraceae bacterium]
MIVAYRNIHQEAIMLMSQRQLIIVDMVRKKGSVQVEELAKELGVSTMTIRRDLVRLDEDGIVERCHGGAVTKQEVTYADKQVSHRDEKVELAGRSLPFIKEGYTIFLDAGTTVYEIARLIEEIGDLMVVTNDLEIAQLLKESSVELILCGGYVQKSTGSMLGYYATKMMEDFRFDAGFFGAASIDDNLNVLTPTIDKAFLKRQLVEQCQESYLVVDDSKFRKQAMTRIHHLSDYTGVITNHVFTKKEAEIVEKRGIHLVNQ